MDPYVNDKSTSHVIFLLLLSFLLSHKRLSDAKGERRKVAFNQIIVLPLAFVVPHFDNESYEFYVNVFNKKAETRRSSEGLCVWKAIRDGCEINIYLFPLAYLSLNPLFLPSNPAAPRECQFSLIQNTHECRAMFVNISQT
jgi:hypothetical protein